MSAPRSVAEALRAAVAELAAAGVPEAAKDARLLLAHALGVAAARVVVLMPDPMPPEAEPRLAEYLATRVQRRPVSHILGFRQFWGRAFHVTSDVLDPRPETETLVAEALAAPFARVLDLGTGTGAILLTLLAERPGATGTATDLSPAALAVAQGNAERLGLSDRASFLEGSWFTPVQGRFDLIVSNPPYIAAEEMAGLSPEVLNWEPHLALSPGGDGLDAYRAIAAGARAHLAPGGRILVEIGPTQGDAVAGLFAAAGLENPRILPDIDGRDRVIAAVNPA